MGINNNQEYTDLELARLLMQVEKILDDIQDRQECEL